MKVTEIARADGDGVTLASPYGYLKPAGWKRRINNGARGTVEKLQTDSSIIVRFEGHRKPVRVPHHWLSREEAAPKAFNDRELAAVLAGLRLLQHHIEGSRADREGIDQILTNCDQIKPLTIVEIGTLCERIN